MKRAAAIWLSFAVTVGSVSSLLPSRATAGEITPCEPKSAVSREKEENETKAAGFEEIVRVEFVADKGYLEAYYEKGKAPYEDFVYFNCKNQTEEDAVLEITSTNTNVVQVTGQTTQTIASGANDAFQIFYRIVGAGCANLVVKTGGEEYKLKVYGVPRNVELTSVTQTSFQGVTVQWEKIPGCSGYRIERAVAADDLWWFDKRFQTAATVYGDYTTSVTLKTDLNTTYRYRVFGFVEDEERRLEGNTDRYPGNVKTIDFAAKKLKAQIASVTKSGSKSLRVQWKPMAGAIAYKLYRSEWENGGYSCIYTAGSGVTSYEQKVSPGVMYSYKVTAVFPEGESDYSKSISEFIPKKGKQKSKLAKKLGQQYISGQYAGNWASPDKTYYYESGKKLYAVCVQKNGSLGVFRISDSLKIKKIKTIKLKYDVWGGFYAGEDGNFYVAVGYHNYSESKTKTVIKIMQYGGNWKKKNTSEIKGGASNVFEGIYKPFEAGSLRMDMQDNLLYVATARQMFLYSDGKRHQSNISFLIDTKTMQEKKAPHAYISHSFNQFVKFKDGTLYLLNHGDAFPRSLALSVFEDYAPGMDERTSEKIQSLCSFQGSSGDNFTGCKVGGMEIGKDNVLVCGTMQPHERKVKGVSGFGDKFKYNVFLARSNRSSGKTSFQWLTGYHPKRSSVVVGEARMIKLSDDKFAILYSTTQKKKTKLNYIVVNDAGKKAYSKKYSGMAFDGDSQPVLYKGKIVWADTAYEGINRTKTKLYSIPAIY